MQGVPIEVLSRRLGQSPGGITVTGTLRSTGTGIVENGLAEGRGAFRTDTVAADGTV
jgi:hypothetical protein